jgi:hypothetical protein
MIVIVMDLYVLYSFQIIISVDLIINLFYKNH